MAKKIEELRESYFHRELGQKICAAFIAQQQGVALGTAFKTTSQPIGDLWLMVTEVARQGVDGYIDTDVLGTMNAKPPKFIV